MGWLKDSADSLYNTYQDYLTQNYLASNSLCFAADCIAAQDWSGAEVNLKDAAISFAFAGEYMAYDGYGFYGCAYKHRSIYYWIEDNWPSDCKVTWQAICEAWIKDDFAGRMPTIAVIDRMRQILWDEPFYVRWAARPESRIE